MRDAAVARPPSSELIPLNRRANCDPREELTESVERLRDGTPVPVCGMAIVQLLLRDSASPLFGRGRARDARALARLALDRLDEPITTAAQ